LLCASFVGAGLWTDTARAQVSKSVVQADISHLGETAHLEFKGLKNWRYDLQKDGSKKIVLTMPPLDTASLTRLQGFSDELVRGVQVDKHGPDGTFVITFELAQSDVESFDYLTDEPSRLIVDFYRKTDADAKNTQSTSPKAEKKATKAKASARARKASGKQAAANGGGKDRRPAGDEFLSVDAKAGKDGDQDLSLKFGIFDGGDDNYDRFRIKDYEIREEAIISSRQNIYLPFPMLKMQVGQLGKLMEEQPEYVIHPKDTRENKEARLLLTLFERKRYAVFLKTYDYFMNRYPESEYTEILKNLAAHVHLERWKEEGKAPEFEQARAMYSELVQKYPESPLREHNYLILGFALMERGEALATLQTFQGFLKTYPSSPEVPLVRNAVAEAYMILRKYDEAMAEYDAIIKDFAKTPYAQEARYRMGDVAFAKGDFNQAIRLYEAAIKDLPAQEKVYPNADFNMAEARFWQKDFKKSLGNYIQFVNLYPSHPHGGYALTRIGELLGVLGADQRRVMGAFLESYFRFPNHPGAKVARIRMLSQQMKGMKPKELKKALEEIEDYSNKLDLPGIKEFTTLMVAEGLTHRGEYKGALANLISYYQKNPTSANLDSFKGRILRNISNELKDEVERGEFLKALEFYGQYQNTWLKNSDRIDIPYFVAGAYERAGAFSEAENIYRETLQRREAIAGTEKEKEKKVQEHLPSIASLHLRLAATMAQDRDYIDAYQQLKAIGPGSTLSAAETVERVRLSALIAEQRNDPARAREALSELAEKWHGDPTLVVPVHLQLAQTYLKLGDAKRAEAHADKVLAAAETESESEGEGEGEEKPVPDKVVADAFEAKAQALLEQKKAMAAVETYQRMLDRFEDKMQLGSIRYRVGQILFDRGDFKGANDVWKRLEGTKNDLLWKIGKEKLEQSQWQGEYNKYIKRIPAMIRQDKSDKKETRQ
jgi:tetratricopeptide (TPR) repeat protein